VLEFALYAVSLQFGSATLSALLDSCVWLEYLFIIII